ncbi:hypothetical protein DL96DRAFT_347787 [Flagelloscypha sp. PMI_526]|nr:hypothetical protein DL96DRAFT_347787 [Flagelloscypha sp. PMI_526]
MCGGYILVWRLMYACWMRTLSWTSIQMSALASSPYSTTMMAGNPQAEDVESNPPTGTQPSLGYRFRWERVHGIPRFVAILVLFLPTSCLTFFCSIALGRSHIHTPSERRATTRWSRTNTFHPVLASGFFAFTITGCLLVYKASAIEWHEQYPITPWILAVFCLISFGPACIALSSQILTVSHAVHVVLKEVLLHYTIGAVVISGGIFAFVMICSLSED